MRNSKFKSIGLASIALTHLLLTGCAKVIKGIHQPVSITSSPPGALIRVDGEDRGRTPAVVKMWRGRSHTVEIEKEGHAHFACGLAKESSGWIWGNIFIGGLIGLVVDLATQASNDLVPGTVHADLQPVAHGADANWRSSNPRALILPTDGRSILANGPRGSPTLEPAGGG
jgi:hypothetical protein